MANYLRDALQQEIHIGDVVFIGKQTYSKLGFVISQRDTSLTVLELVSRQSGNWRNNGEAREYVLDGHIELYSRKNICYYPTRLIKISFETLASFPAFELFVNELTALRQLILDKAKIKNINFKKPTFDDTAGKVMYSTKADLDWDTDDDDPIEMRRSDEEEQILNEAEKNDE